MLDGDTSHWLPEPGALPALRDITVPDLLDEAVERRPDGEALVYSAYGPALSLRLTYAELRERVRQISRALLGSGLEPGDRALILATNLPQYPLLQLACAYVNIVVVPVNPLYRQQELAYVLDLAKPAAAFVQPAERKTRLADIFERAAAGSHRPRLQVSLGDPAGEPSLGWDEWLAGATSTDPDEVARRRNAVAPGDLSQIQFTSGTTGRPKGVELSHWILANQGIQMAGRAGLGEDDRYVNPMPMFHCGGCVLGALGSLAAAATHLPIVAFDPKPICETIETERATVLAGVPTMLLAIEEERLRSGRRLDSLRVVVTGGSTVPPVIGAGWKERFGVSLVITYGQTEFGPLACVTSPLDPTERQLKTVGRPIPHVELDVVEPGTSTRVPIGADGELRYRGFVMRGYHGAPEATAEAVDADGWLRSGDIGCIDEEGYVQITGRAKEMIIRGGENISPAAVEDAVRSLAAVADVSVIGVPDEKMGEELCAFVRLHEGDNLDVGEMRDALLPQVARFMIPRYLAVVDAFPLTPSGKVQRFKLSEMIERNPEIAQDSRDTTRAA